jgi:hypothetical protein
MALKFWKDEAKTTAIRSELGKITGNGSLATVSCSTPDHVRRYSTAEYFGKLLTETTQYTFADGVLTMVTTPATGECVVAIGAGEYLFENLDAAGNDSLEANRTLEQMLYIESADADAINVTISINDYYTGGGLSVSHHYLSLDSGGVAQGYLSGGSALSLGTISSGSVIPFWCKSIIPEGTAMMNYNDIYIAGYSKNYSTEP